MSFKTVAVELSAAVAAGETVVFGYPTGSVQADFDPAGAHLAVIAGAAKASADNDFSLTFGASSVTFTNGSGKATMPAGRILYVQMAEFAPDITGDDVAFTNIDAGASGAAGSVDVFPATASKGKTAFTAADNAGNTTTTIRTAEQAAARTYTVPDAGASASFIMSAGAQTFTGAQTLNGVPPAEAQSVDPSQKVTLFDDFLSDTIDAAKWSDGEGSDAQAVGPAAVANSLNGEIAFTTGDVGGGAGAVDAAGLSGQELHWKANQGGLAVEARVKLGVVANACLFVGFTDLALEDGAMEMPLEATGTADVIAGEAADCAGILYDTELNSATKFVLGSNVNGTPTVAVVHAAGPADDTYVVLRVELSAAGVLTGYVDGVAFGSTIASAITITDPLAPCVVASSRTTTSVLCTVDYIWAQQNR